MPTKKTGKPAMAGLKPLPKGRGFDPASLKGTKGPAGPKLVPKRGMIPGKSGQRQGRDRPLIRPLRAVFAGVERGPTEREGGAAGQS